MDVNWTLPSRLEDNPTAWLIEIDGIIVDVRNCETWVQEEAFRRGFIPYIPKKNNWKFEVLETPTEAEIKPSEISGYNK